MQGARGRMRRLAHRTPFFSNQFKRVRFEPGFHHVPALTSAVLAKDAPQRSSAMTDLNLLRHELRTPLTGMLGLAEMLAALELPAKATFWLATLQACGQQMASLIDRALLPREPDSRSGLPVAIDGLHLLESMLAAHWPAARASGSRLMLAFHPEARGIWQLDATVFRQALDNLLINAIRFSPNGQVLLEVRATTPQLEGSGSLELVIEDSGPNLESDSTRSHDGSEFADRTYRMSSRGRGLVVTEQACRSFAGSLQRSPGSVGGARFTLVLNGIVPREQKLLRPFRPALLQKLRCLLKLEPLQQRALVAMLGCLDISFEILNGEAMPDVNELPPGQILICAQALLPQSLRQRGSPSVNNSTWLLMSHAGTSGPEFHQQLLPEPLFQADLQNGLLRCLVIQGMAACQQEVQA